MSRESMGGSLAAAAAVSVGSTPARPQKVAYLLRVGTKGGGDVHVYQGVTWRGGGHSSMRWLIQREVHASGGRAPIA